MALIASGSAASTDSNAVSAVVTLNTTGATLIVVAVAAFQYTGRYLLNSNAPVDGKGNTLSGLTLKESADTFSGIRLFYVNSATPTVGSGHTFQAGPNNDTSYPLVWAWAFDSTGASPFSAESGAIAAGSPTSLQMGASIGVNTNIAVCAVCNNLGTGTAQAIDSSFTITGSKYGFVGGTHGAGAAGYAFLTGAVQPTWSSLDGSGTAGVIATFTATGGGGGGGGSPWNAYAQQRGKVERTWDKLGKLWIPQYSMKIAA